MRVHPLGWIVLAGAVARLALWAWGDSASLPVWDERDYNALAVNLATRGEFAIQPGQPTSIRPPLYPLAVAGIYEAAGVENFSAVRLVQGVVSLVTVVLVYWLGSLMSGRWVGTWAAGLCAFYPSLLGYNNLLLTEVLFSSLLVATCLAATVALQRDSLGLMVAAGTALGLAALTRSVMWVFPGVLVPFLLVAGRGGAGRRLAATGCLLVAFAATIAPWAARNTRLQGTFTTVDVMGGRNFMMGNYEHTPMNRAWNSIAIEGDRSWHHVLTAVHPEYDRLTQGQKDKLALRAAIRFVLEHPWLTLKRDVVKFFNFWGLERELIAGASRNDFGPMGTPTLLLLTVVIFGSYVAALLLGVFGAVVSPPADWRAHALLLLVIGFICAMHALSFGHSRYHLPLIPLVLIYSAQAIVHAREIWARRRSLAFGVACVLAVILVAGWAIEVTVVDFRRFLDAVRPAA